MDYAYSSYWVYMTWVAWKVKYMPVMNYFYSWCAKKWPKGYFDESTSGAAAATGVDDGEEELYQTMFGAKEENQGNI